MPALLARVREVMQKSPVARYGVIILAVAVIGFVVSRLVSGPPAPTRAPAPPPSATPAPRAAAPAPAPTPAPAAPQAPRSTAVPPGPTGRPDPFIPLVTQPGPGGAPLPPPPFPPGPGQLPPPPLPGQVPFGGETGIAVTGIVGDTKSVAVINLGGRTEIVMVGETIGDLRVLRIDSTRRVVTFLRAGRRFDVAMGGE